MTRLPGCACRCSCSYAVSSAVPGPARSACSPWRCRWNQARAVGHNAHRRQGDRAPGPAMTSLRVVDRDGVEHEVDANPGFTLMENLRDLEYGVAAICGGMCACATCHVYVDPEWFPRLP